MVNTEEVTGGQTPEPLPQSGGKEGGGWNKWKRFLISALMATPLPTLLFLSSLISPDQGVSVRAADLPTYSVPPPAVEVMPGLATPEAILNPLPVVESGGETISLDQGLTPILPLDEIHLNFDSTGWDRFQNDFPENVSRFVERSQSAVSDPEGKDAMIIKYHNLWNLDTANPEEIAYIFYHYEKYFEDTKTREALLKILPGFKAMNELIRSRLGVGDFVGADKVSEEEFALFPETEEEIFDKLVFAPADSFPGGGGETGKVAIVFAYPISMSITEERENEWLNQVLPDVVHEWTHLVQQTSKYNILDWESDPDFHLSHLCTDLVRVFVARSSGLPLEMSGDVLLMVDRLREAGYSDPVKLVLQTAIHPAKAKNLRVEYDSVRKPGDKTAQELVDDLGDSPLSIRASKYLWGEWSIYMPADFTPAKTLGIH